MPFPAPPPPPPVNPFRVPPSSQPPPRLPAKSKFPTLTQRPGTRLPPIASSQSQRPAHLDGPYSPPSSQQATQLFDPYPSSQPPQLGVETLSRPRPRTTSVNPRERTVSRPPSSLGPRAGLAQAQGQGQRHRSPSTFSQHPLAGPSAHVDQYRPPKTAVDVYQGDRASAVPQSQPKAQKGAEILENLAGLRTWLEDKFTEKEEEDKEAKENLDERFKSLEEENKDLKERLHELSMGQKILPTREEVGEEITGQLSPALHEFFGTLNETLRTTISPLPEHVASLSAKKVKLDMLEMQDMAKKEAMKQGAVESPLMTLLNHLIQKLGPLDDITATLASLSGLPEALEQVAVFRQTMEAMQARFTNQQPQPQRQIEQAQQIEISTYQTQMTQLQQSIDQIKRKVDSSPSSPGTSQDDGKVLAAIAELKATVDQLKLAAPPRIPHPEGDQQKDVSALLELVSDLKRDIAEMKERPTITTQTPGPAASHDDTRKILQTLLAEVRVGQANIPNAVAIDFPTPDTAPRPLHTTQGPQQASALPTRKMDRPVKPTSKARQDPPTFKAITKRAGLTGSRDPLSLFGTGVANGPADASTGLEPDDVFGAVQTIDTAGRTTVGSKRKADPGTAPLTATYSTIAEALAYQSADPPTPPRPRPHESIPDSTQSASRNSSSGSLSRQSKKRKTATGGADSASLEIKKQGLLGSFKPTTRSDATKARGLGIEVIDLASSDSSSAGRKGSGSAGGQGRTTSASGQKTSESGQKVKQSHKKGMGKGRVRVLPKSITPPVLPARSSQPQVEPAPEPNIARPAGAAAPFAPEDWGQDLGEDAQSQSQTQPQTQTQDIEPTQLNESNPDSTFDFGHGQFPSVPTLPAYESTENIETEAETQLNPTLPQAETIPVDEGLTSSEQVERSLMETKVVGRGTSIASEATSDDLFLANLNRPREEEEATSTPTPTPKRAEPAYRRWQKPKAENEGGAAKPGFFSSLTQKNKNFLSMMVDSDDED